jgi:hypothetical protein
MIHSVGIVRQPWSGRPGDSVVTAVELRPANPMRAGKQPATTSTALSCRCFLRDDDGPGVDAGHRHGQQSMYTS